MLKIPEIVLKKMSKADLVNLVNQLYEEHEKIVGAQSPKATQPNKAPTMAELDEKLNSMDRSDRVPRNYVTPKYTCHICNNNFIDETSIFRKDVNDPVCFGCRRTR